jgi:hypothetical protein
MPLRRGRSVITMSSGAATAGSPLSGGYAGAKATIRFITGYTADESERAGLDIGFISVLPKLTAATGLGSMAASAYARSDHLDLDAYLPSLGPALTLDQVERPETDRLHGKWTQRPLRQASACLLVHGSTGSAVRGCARRLKLRRGPFGGSRTRLWLASGHRTAACARRPVPRTVPASACPSQPEPMIPPVAGSVSHSSLTMLESTAKIASGKPTVAVATRAQPHPIRLVNWFMSK